MTRLDDTGFRGDLDWLHRQEGHRGHPYWPGGQSGITLDPGVDLCHAELDTLWLYRDHLADRQWIAVLEMRLREPRLRGSAAFEYLAAFPVLGSIRIPRTTARKLLPAVARPYWLSICRRFPPLLHAPPPVQTAMLSLAYNRGPWNKALNPCREPIHDGNWRSLGAVVATMQQVHPLAGVRRRRREEGALIQDTA